jgi:hypothetical protein
MEEAFVCLLWAQEPGPRDRPNPTKPLTAHDPMFAILITLPDQGNSRVERRRLECYHQPHEDQRRNSSQLAPALYRART